LSSEKQVCILNWIKNNCANGIIIGFLIGTGTTIYHQSIDINGLKQDTAKNYTSIEKLSDNVVALKIDIAGIKSDVSSIKISLDKLDNKITRYHVMSHFLGDSAIALK
jgi:hypothetical protein